MFTLLESQFPRYAKRRLTLFCGLLGLLIVSAWLGTAFGAAGINITLPVRTLMTAMGLGNVDGSLSAIQNIVLNIRVPRVIMALLVGAALAVSGASLQGICRNPLADPGLLGISAGAAVGAVAMILASQTLFTVMPELTIIGPYAISIAAILGAALTAFAVYHLAQMDGQLQVPTLLLAGVAINALGVAIIGTFNYIADDQALRQITFWLMGSLGGATWASVAILLPALGFALWVIFKRRHAINLLLLGEANARYCGVDVDRIKRELLWLNALVVGVAVAFSGTIAFVGLVVPHILRIYSDTNYRFLIINSALLGGALLALADMVSRLAIAPAELPIGILTSLIGAPFFIALLIKQKRNMGFGL